MASTTKRRFTDEFKREAVALWETSGRLQTEVAAELGIMPTMLRRWQRKQQEIGPPPASPAGKPPVSTMASPADQASEIARLRRELDRTRMERDILKNVWPAPSARGILKCSDQSASTYAVSWVTPWPRWTSARLEPQ